jgi:hypothetical protein
VLGEFPFMMKMMMKSCNFGSVAKGPMPNGPSQDSRLGCQGCRDYHSHPGVMSKTWKSKAEFHDDFYKVLTKTGEQDQTGKGMAKKMDGGCTIL